MLNLTYKVTMCSAYANDLNGNAPSEGEMIREADGDEDGQINNEECFKMMLARWLSLRWSGLAQ